MRTVLFLSTLLLTSAFVSPLCAEEPLINILWHEILKEHVREGRVDYASLKKNRAGLHLYLGELASVTAHELDRSSREERIAYWINFYNAAVIHVVLDHYPVESIEAIPEVFEKKVNFGRGSRYSLGELREELLRPGFQDERIVIALVSGREDSPRLFKEAFVGPRLDTQLDEAVRMFVDDDRFNRITPDKRKIYLSPLFDEYGADFILNFKSVNKPKKFSEAEAAVVGFLLHHSDDPEKRIFLHSGKYKIDHLSKSPQLNDVRQQ